MTDGTTFRCLAAVALCATLVACDAEPPPRSTSEFMENPILLEAAVVRCNQNRAESRYDPECMNAREAVKIIEAREEAEHRAALEAESERKRQALRRTQRAAAEARRRAEEERRRREEAEYLAQFGELPPEETSREEDFGNAPIAVVPDAEVGPEAEPISSPYDEAAPAPEPVTGSNAPAVEVEAEPDAADLEAIREELRRRSESGNEHP